MPALHTSLHARDSCALLCRSLPSAPPACCLSLKRSRAAWWPRRRVCARVLACMPRYLREQPHEEQKPEVDGIDRSARPTALATAALLLLAAGTICTGPALAATHSEPANALSVPTWVIHISSVIEWTSAMLLVWKYAEATGSEKWKGLTWGMMPLFASSLCACTYHLFYNNPELDFLVALQAGLTWIGNATLWAAAYRIFKDSRRTATPS